MINTKIKWWLAIRHRARSLLRVNFVNKHWISVRWTVCETVSFRFNCSDIPRFGSGSCFVCLSENSRYSAPFTSVNSSTSPHFIRRCSSHPLNPKCLVFRNHIVFSKASAFEIPSNFLSCKMFTSSSVIASAAFGLFSLPSFLSSYFELLKLVSLVQTGCLQ